MSKAHMWLCGLDSCGRRKEDFLAYMLNAVVLFASLPSSNEPGWHVIVSIIELHLTLFI